MKQFFGWILTLGGIALLLGVIISSPMTLGWGIFGPIPHFIGVGLIFWGQGLFRSADEHSEAGSKAGNAASWFGIIAGSMLFIICIFTLLISAPGYFGEIYSDGRFAPVGWGPVIGLVLTIVFALTGAWIAIISYRRMKRVEHENTPPPPQR